MPDMPTIELSDELKEQLRSQLNIALEDQDTDEMSLEYPDEVPLQFPPQNIPEQPAPKRRGRVPFKRNPDGSYARDANGVPIKDYDARPSSTTRPTIVSSRSVPTNPLPAAPLTKREEKQVTERLSSILVGATGIPALVRPYIQMTEEEARAIADPLSSYLIRMEPTSKIAHQILDEYDIVAVFFAIMAYGVRVYIDFQKEREVVNVATNQIPIIPRRSSSESAVDGGRSDGPIEDNSGETRYVGPVSTPISEGHGVLPQL